jgi:hypothetical protein
MVQWRFPIMQAMVNSLFRTLAALSFALVLGLARADDQPYEADPPDRAARLSYIQGDVSMQPAGEQDWAPALLNRPLTTGDKLWTERDARAEIQVGQAAVRLGANTGFSFLNVDDDTIQMRMTAGVINVRVRALDENDHIEIDTPNVALSLVRPGNYRVEFDDPNNVTVVRISEGEAEATGPSQNFVVHNQEVATVRGIEGQGVQFATLGAPDEFDSWSLERDRGYERVASSPTAEYVSPDVTGYEDLNDNGTWSSEAEYGYVWTPSRVSAGWAPYQYGRWVWVSPWGWTWIDDAPWGYAPFHYGRWAYARNRWCWVPGPRHVRAVYAPAVVGWVGGPGFSIGVTSGPGRVGWFPLGPRDVYVPPRRYSHRYVERVNVTNAIVNRIYLRNVYENRGKNARYRNREVPGAVTAVDRNVFTSAGRVGDHRVRGDDREFSRAVATAVAPQIAPSRESRLGGAAHANVRVPPRNVVDRQVVVKRNPPPPVTRFTRSSGGRPETLREAEDLNPRPRVRDDRDDRDEGRVAVDRNRPDRPPRTEMSSPKTPPRVQTVAPDQRGSAERPRQDRQPRTETSSPKMAPREYGVAPDQRVSAERARQQQERSQEQRVQMFREQAAQQQRRAAETQQRQQRPDNQVRQQHEQRRQQVESSRAQRPAPPPQQSERNTQRPRAERADGNDGPRQRDNKNR